LFSPIGRKRINALGEGSNREGTSIFHVDGSSNIKGNRFGLRLVLTSLNGDKIEQSIRCGFQATNNEAKYEALIARMVLAKEMAIK